MKRGKIRKKPLMFDPEQALRVEVKSWKRPMDGRTINQKTYIFPCSNGCGSEIRIRSGDLSNETRSKTCRKCYYDRLPEMYRLRPFEALYNSIRKRASKFGSVMNYEEFLSFTVEPKCHYCSAEIEWNEYNAQHRKAYNLDRKDNDLGYTVDNCVVCCWRCNLVKSSVLTYDQMLRLAPILKQFTLEENGKAIKYAKHRWIEYEKPVVETN